MTGISLYGANPGILDRRHHKASHYRDVVSQAARLSEQHGHVGTLVHHNFHALDAWAIANVIGACTQSLVPLIATQPTAMPPHSLARCVIAYAHLFDRRVDLNVITGARSDELAATGDGLDHDARYHRLIEYVRLVRALLEAREPVTWEGEFYAVDGLVLEPHLPADLAPRVFVAGSSPGGMKAARAIADVAVHHPPPLGDYAELAAHAGEVQQAIRVGILARDTAEEAWREAHSRFPGDRRGMIQTVAKTGSESFWVRELAERSLAEDRVDEVFWLGPYRNAQSYAPYLVGSYSDVRTYVRGYMAHGVSHMLLDGPWFPDEFAHVDCVTAPLTG